LAPCLLDRHVVVEGDMHTIVRVKHGVWASMGLAARKRFHRYATGVIPEGWRVTPIAVVKDERSLAVVIQHVYRESRHDRQ
jgi:hypothetical protein